MTAISHTLQAGAVAIDGRAVLIVGPPGSGKSSLALALIDRGAVLIGDDGVVLSVNGGQLLAAPHPQTRGLLEVRNIGLLPFAVTADLPVALLLRLDGAAPRHIEHAVCETIVGLAIPRVSLWPGSAMLALRAEQALRIHGLRAD